MHYDHISFHLERFPAELKPQQAAHHIGYYYAWAVSQNLHSPEAEDLPSFPLLQGGYISGTDFILSEFDGGIDETCFNELGNRFTQYYYEDEEEGYGHFIDDYFQALDLNSESGFYRTEDTPENQAKLNAVFQMAFEKWQNSLKEVVEPSEHK